MSKKLTTKEQVKLYRALPARHKAAVEKAVGSCCGKIQSGQGWGSFFSKVVSVAKKAASSPIVRQIGKEAWRSIILPTIKRKVRQRMGGSGLRLAGSGWAKALGVKSLPRAPPRRKMARGGCYR